jgi:hypothetical protein
MKQFAADMNEFTHHCGHPRGAGRGLGHPDRRAEPRTS